MTTCHECGSEIAENDVFCPFCGISLQPIEVDDGQADASFDSTIIMPSPAAKSPKAGPATDAPQPGSEPAVALPPSEKITLDSVDLNEVPTPPALTDLENTAGSLFKDLEVKPSQVSADIPSGPIRKDESAVVETKGETLISDAPTLDNDDFAVFKNNEPVESIEEVKEPEVVDSESESAAVSDAHHETLKEAEVPPPVSFDVSVKTNVVPDEPEAVQMVEEPAISTPVDLPPTPPADESFPVQEMVEDFRTPENESISKPLNEELPGDQFSSPSMFDSVQIMQNSGHDLDNVGTGEEEKLFNAKNAESAQVAGETSSIPGVADEVKPQTTPNIGLIDTDGRKSAKLKPLEEGAVLNTRYEIVRKIGGGGMGAVYLASDNNLGGVLRAVKEMVQSYIEEEQQEKAVLDFKRESMILSTLDHPSIPTIYDYFFDQIESRFYLVMKYISGGDLSARLRSAPEGKLDELTVTEWAIQIADVLDYLHNQPSTIVYRDLKPSNIMIDGNSGRVMLIDFGIARSIGQKEEKGVTAVGTMGYAPPELFSGNVEPRSDIYSLGSTMFHLLTGADPQSNPLLIFDFQKNPRPRQINPQLSDQIERFLMKAVEYSASSRFTSAAEMRQNLEEHLENLRRGSVTHGVKEIPASVSLANQNVFCGFCGQKIVATDLFCAFCGAKQPIAQHGVHSEIYTPAAMTAKLFVIGTSDLDSPIFQLEKTENLLGRRDPMSNIFPEVDLSKYDPQTKISRRHAKIWREGSSFLLEDLGSSNGTILFPAVSDSKRLLPHQPQALSNGDKIKLGDTTLHFVVG